MSVIKKKKICVVRSSCQKKQKQTDISFILKTKVKRSKKVYYILLKRSSLSFIVIFRKIDLNKLSSQLKNELLSNYNNFNTRSSVLFSCDCSSQRMGRRKLFLLDYYLLQQLSLANKKRLSRSKIIVFVTYSPNMYLTVGVQM